MVGGACRTDVDGTDPATSVARVVPANVSNPDAWALFDRSASSTFTPAAEPVRITLDRAEQLEGVKVYGGGPYLLRVTGDSGTALGFSEIDLSSVTGGWHTFPSTALVATAAVELRFEPLGPATPIPEVELWAVDRQPGIHAADLTAKDPGPGYLAFEREREV